MLSSRCSINAYSGTARRRPHRAIAATHSQRAHLSRSAVARAVVAWWHSAVRLFGHLLTTALPGTQSACFSAVHIQSLHHTAYLLSRRKASARMQWIGEQLSALTNEYPAQPLQRTGMLTRSQLQSFFREQSALLDRAEVKAKLRETHNKASQTRTIRGSRSLPRYKLAALLLQRLKFRRLTPRRCVS